MPQAPSQRYLEISMEFGNDNHCGRGVVEGTERIPMCNARVGGVVVGLLLLISGFVNAAENNTLTDEEKKAGWKLLFDGKTTDGWRGYKMEKMPAGWRVIDGALVRVQGGEGG